MSKLKGLSVTFDLSNGKNLILSNQVSNHFMLTIGNVETGFMTVTVPKEQFMQAVIVLANEMHIEKEEGEETNE